MNPLMLYRSLPYIIIVVLAAALSWTTHLYLGKRDQLASLTATVRSFGQAAEKAAAEKTAEYADNLKTVKEDHEALTPAIRDAAVRNYIAAHPGSDAQRVCINSPGRGIVPGTAPGIKMDDGAKQEPISVEQSFIEDAADDANKLAAWQEYAKLNHLLITN